MTARPESRSGRRLRAACLLIGLGLSAGCTSVGSHAAAPPAPTAPAATAPLATSMAVVGGGTWAIVQMGGSAAQEDNFWELFTRPAASAPWELVTPPGVADNGGLVAAASGGSVTVAFRPSQGLTFSPLALTDDGGKTWGTDLMDGPVASVPDAFAAASGGKQLALLSNGAVDQSAGSGARWSTLAGPGAIAASAAGRQCQVTGLTAVAYTPSGTPLAAASCAKNGVIGIFAGTGDTWQEAGPAAVDARQVRVIQLTSTSSGDTALLQAGTGAAASLFAAWTGNGTRWTESSPLPIGSGQVLASGTGPGGAAWVLLPGGRAVSVSVSVSGPGAAWRELPTLPRGTAALAAGPNGGFQALAVSGANLTVFQLTAAGAWNKTQLISVPIQYGSSS
jgi:hypothetical protein